MWQDLPIELTLLILRFHRQLRSQAVIRIASAWRGYRLRILLGRYKMLRHIRIFQVFNADIFMFLMRARL